MARFANNLGNFGRTGCEDSIKHAGSSGTSQVAQMSPPPRDVTFRTIASTTHDDPHRPSSISVDSYNHSCLVSLIDGIKPWAVVNKKIDSPSTFRDGAVKTGL